ncbi:hypothetical protein ACTPEM_26360, partial [Clostridioides difficile]
FNLFSTCNKQTESGPPERPKTILSPFCIKLCLFIVLSTLSNIIFILNFNFLKLIQGFSVFL